MHKVVRPNLVLVIFRYVHREAWLEHRQPIMSHKAIVDLPVGTPKAVGEVKEESEENA